MIKPEIPANETQRLAALDQYQILDTLPEQVYDDIAFLATQICEVPIALISLVDSNRQWFKAKVGIDTDEMQREVALCSHAIVSPEELMIVKDTHRDERFFDNPLVTGAPNIRFYAGAPLITPEGHAVGTLCTIDSKPRKLTPLQKNALAVLSRQIIAQLELRLKIAELEEMEARLRNLSVRDDLTNLYNRRGFFANSRQLVKLARRTDSPISVIYIDVDGLKQVNDEHGHERGSEMILDAANILKENFRDSDVVARLGGDEFAIFLINSSRNYVERAVERLHLKVENFNKNHEKPYKLSLSIGYASNYRIGDTEISELLEKADQAMYREKRKKKDAVKSLAGRQGLEPR